MIIIAGLGNPGVQYQHNRHNIGFMALDGVHRRYSLTPWTKKFHAEIAHGVIDDQKVLLVKPMTFMNDSGRAVSEALRFYKTNLSDLIVIHDELDIAPGKFRLKTGGSSGGHNGIRSIDAHCGNGYHRLRLGIGHPGAKDRVQSYVLGDFSQDDAAWRDPLLAAIADNVALLVQHHDQTFLNRVAATL